MGMHIIMLANTLQKMYENVIISQAVIVNTAYMLCLFNTR